MDKNMPKLAEIMGNSVQMITRYYDDPKLPREGRAWFAITPKKDGKIIAFGG